LILITGREIAYFIFISGVVLAEIQYHFNEKQFREFIDTLDVKEEIVSYNQPWIKKG